MEGRVRNGSAFFLHISYCNIYFTEKTHSLRRHTTKIFANHIDLFHDKN